MAKIFISHSSKDKGFARQLASELAELGHEPWLDEWEIKVGDSIISKVERGIEDADYVVVVLSPNSVSSNWVNREWKAKYWAQIERGNTMVLPVLLCDCEIPPLLRMIKHADFRGSHAVGFVDLVAAIAPTMPSQATPEHLEVSRRSAETTDLLAKVQAGTAPLSQCLAEALALARKENNAALEEFCRGELAGYNDRVESVPSYRSVEAFVQLGPAVNLQYLGWGQDPDRVISYLRQNSNDYPPVGIAMGYPVAELERRACASPQGKALVQFTLKAGHLDPKAKRPDAPVLAYASGDALERILSSIRQLLTDQLLEMLPRAGGLPGEESQGA